MLLADALLGDNLLPLLVLALGGAMVVGYGLALVRPPAASKGTGRALSGPPKGGRAPSGGRKGGPAGRGAPARPARPPLARSLVMMGVGLVAALWALASLVSHSH